MFKHLIALNTYTEPFLGMKPNDQLQRLKKKTSVKNKDKKEEENENELSEEANEEDEFNVSLAVMENEIKPKVLKTIFDLKKKYNKLVKYQKEKLDSILNCKKFSTSKERN